MRILIFNLIILCTFILTAEAQTFEVIVMDSAVSGPPGESYDLKAQLINSGGQVLALAVVRAAEELPDDWTSSLCLGETCYPSVTDSVTSVLNAGDTLDFKLTVNTGDQPGTGQVQMRFRDMVTNDITEIWFLVETEITQTFEIIVHDSLLTVPAGGTYDMKMDIVNLMDIPMALAVIRVEEDLPEDWSTSLCLGETCYPSMTDSVSGFLPEGDTLEFKLTVNTAGIPGTGQALIRFLDLGAGYAEERNCQMETFLPAAQFDVQVLDSLMDAPAGASFDLEAHVINLSEETLDISIIRLQNDIPNGWNTSLCVGATCFPFFTDSVTESVAGHDTIAFKLTFNTDSIPASGEVQVRFGEQGTEFADTVVFKASTQSTSIEDEIMNPVSGFRVLGNYPNPFNPVTVIRYRVGNNAKTHDYASLQNRQYIELSVYDSRGAHIRTLYRGNQTAGEHTIRFDASGLASGIYYYQIRSGQITDTKRMLLIR